MKDVIKVLKLFLLDWLILIFMYVLGSVIIKFDPKGSFDFVANIGSIWPSSLLVDLITYLFISLSTVVLVVYLLNKSFLKISNKLFLISQIAFIISFVLGIFLVSVLI